MSGAQALNSSKPTITQTDEEERRKATLLLNELVGGSEEIAEQILANGKAATFRKGQKIIKQGDNGDQAYFILSGSAEIRINNRHIDMRSAPEVVGEMAAKRAGSSRTADVIARSDHLEVLEISGTDFRKLVANYPSFARSLDDSIDRLSRSKIAQLGEKAEVTGLSWTALSAIVGGVSSVFGALAAWHFELSSAYIFFSSVPFGLVMFVVVLLLNPDLRYRNISSAAAGTLVLLIAYGSLSFALTIDGKDVALPLIDFSVETEQKLGVFGIGAVALLMLTWIGGILDLKLRKEKGDH